MDGAVMTGFTIHQEAPKAKLVTMGQANKEIEMAKEPNPDDYYLPSGATEPVLKNPEAAGVDVIKKEPASKEGPVGANDEPRKAETSSKKK